MFKHLSRRANHPTRAFIRAAKRMPGPMACPIGRTTDREPRNGVFLVVEAFPPESLSPLQNFLSFVPARFLMPLTPDQQRAVADHLRSRAQPPQCPVCGASNMVVQEEIILLPTAHEDTADEPMINIVCKYCGYVLHLSPSAIGLSVE